MTSTFVLIHGAGHGGWCWKGVAAQVRSSGHDVYTPTLTGFGERSHLHVDSFETLISDVINMLEFEDLKDVVLVGHSLAGVVIPRVAERAAERLRAVVWLAAVVTRDGENLVEARNAAPRSPWLSRVASVSPDGVVTAENRDELARVVLHDATQADRERFMRLTRPTPPCALIEPGRLTDFLALGIPTAYITASDDRVVIPEAAEVFASLLPGCRRLTVDGGHDCMITRPRRLADLLGSVGQPAGDTRTRRRSPVSASSNRGRRQVGRTS